MAKLKKIEFRDHDKLDRPIEAHVEIFIDDGRRGAQSELFCVRVPEQFVDLIKDDTDAKDKYHIVDTYRRGRTLIAVKGDSAADAEKNWKEFILYALSVNATSEKVIIYKVGFQSRTKHSRPKDRWGSYADTSKEAKLEFDFNVCNKRTVGTKSTYYNIKDDKDNIASSDDVGARVRSDKDWIEVPYSAEAEIFFKGIYNSMELLMGKFKEFLGDSALATKAIESQQKLIK